MVQNVSWSPSTASTYLPGSQYLNMKTVFPRYGHSHVKDKTVVETVLSLTWESLYWLDSIFSCDQAAIWLVQSVRLSVRLSIRLSVCPSHLFHHVPIIVSSWNFQELLPWSEVMSVQKVKVRGQRSRSQRSTPNLAVSGLRLQFEFTYGNKIMHTAGSSIEEVPYCFSRSSFKFQGHTALKIVELDPDWAFPDCNSSLNAQMATKWCTKLAVP